MIEFISGKLIEKTPAYAIISCNGVGYILNISINTFSQIKDEENCKLFVHEAIREDAYDLYGFFKQKERTLFRLLISVSGVGSNTARVMLSSLNPDEITIAIANEDVNTLKSVKGIGAKTAERVIVDLKDKIDKLDIDSEISGIKYNTIKEEALSALVMLGFNRSNATKTVNKIVERKGEDHSVESVIKQALKML